MSRTFVVVPLKFTGGSPPFGKWLVGLKDDHRRYPRLLFHVLNPCVHLGHMRCAPDYEQDGLIHFELPDLDPMAVIASSFDRIVGPFLPRLPIDGGETTFGALVEMLLELRKLYNRANMVPQSATLSNATVPPSRGRRLCSSLENQEFKTAKRARLRIESA